MLSPCSCAEPGPTTLQLHHHCPGIPTCRCRWAELQSEPKSKECPSQVLGGLPGTASRTSAEAMATDGTREPPCQVGNCRTSDRRPMQSWGQVHFPLTLLYSHLSYLGQVIFPWPSCVCSCMGSVRHYF